MVIERDGVKGGVAFEFEIFSSGAADSKSREIATRELHISQFTRRVPSIVALARDRRVFATTSIVTARFKCGNAHGPGEIGT